MTSCLTSLESEGYKGLSLIPADAGHVFFREFFKNNYSELKTLNPNFPILLREGTGAQPYLLATYGEPLPIVLILVNQSICEHAVNSVSYNKNVIVQNSVTYLN